jgi:SAM-dependent methyltransferase
VREGVHSRAAVGFERAAAAYQRGRAGYPHAAIEAILAATDAAPGRTLLELGAGTGKLTSALTGSGARVIALEPVAGMRELLAQTAPAAEPLDAVAELIPLPDGSVDGVIAAQAFHWFEPVATAAEIARVLAPGGAVALIWNRRDERVAWVSELSRILDAEAGDTPRYKHSDWRRGFDANPAFQPLELHTWPHRGEPGRDVILERVASVSFVATLDETARSLVLAEVASLLETHPETRGRDDVALPYVTELFTTRKREP